MTVKSATTDATAGEQAPDSSKRGKHRRIRLRSIWLTLAVIFHTLGFFTSLNAVMTARTSQGAIAWAISLITFPYMAVPAYWFLGRSRFHGYVTARQSGDVNIQERLETRIRGPGAVSCPGA